VLALLQMLEKPQTTPTGAAPGPWQIQLGGIKKVIDIVTVLAGAGKSGR
jgi:hypothetical protein